MEEALVALGAWAAATLLVAGCLRLLADRRREALRCVRRLAGLPEGEPGWAERLVAGWRRRLLRRKRLRVIEESLDGVLLELAELLRSGLGLLQAVEMLRASADGVWREIWERVLQGYAGGDTLASSLRFVLGEEGAPTLVLLARACGLQQRQGGDLAAACLRLAEDHRERCLLRREALAKSGEARFTARFLACLPFGMVAYLLLAAPEMLRPLLAEPVGRLAAGYAVVSWSLGSWLVARSARVLRADW